MGKYILALDQGTTSSRSILFDEKLQAVAQAQKEFTQIFPQEAWVEHDPLEIWDSQLFTIKEVVKKAGIAFAEIAAIGITNQRETTVVWDKISGKPVYNAIVWQDRRTAAFCEELKQRKLSDYVKENTGLVIDSYFSGTKLNWILNHVEAAQNHSNLLFGTIDTWLIWKLTKGVVHATDVSNASRTMLYNIKQLKWDAKLLSELEIPESLLPEIKPSSGRFGCTHKTWFDDAEIPILGVAGDQQAALFGQACFEEGMAKNTYGTGCFMLMNTGQNAVQSKNGLLTTIAWQIGSEVTYALEGSVFIAGAAIQWLRDGLKIIHNAQDSEVYASAVHDSEGLVVVPAFAGLGAPYWDMYARGAIFGLTRATTSAHLIRATLESLAFQTKDVLDAMEKDATIQLTELMVDGGAAANNFLMQFQSDILNTRVVRPKNLESTALGAACLAALAAGVISQEQFAEQKETDASFVSQMSETERKEKYKLWQKAVERTMAWSKND